MASVSPDNGQAKENIQRVSKARQLARWAKVNYAASYIQAGIIDSL